MSPLWKERLEQKRKEKDRFFAAHWQSPVPLEERPEFRGLRYYPIDPDFRFELELYEHSDKKMIFVPFRDATSGRETYGAGRYLDLDLGNCTTNGRWVLDFNRAYNPWCAYSENYACPFVHSESWLKVPIEAGEKNYKKSN